MNEYKQSLRYTDNEMNRRSKTNSATDNTRKMTKVKGRKTINKSKRYTTKEIGRNRLIALALAGVATLGIGVGVKSVIDRIKEEKYVSNFEEVDTYNVQASQLGISQELYDNVMQFKEEINGTDLTQVSNQKLAEYFGNIGDMYLEILKNKVASITGMKTQEFKLYAPTFEEGIYSDTRIIQPETELCIGTIKSDEIQDYMLDLLKARDCRDTLLYGDVDREKLEKKLSEMTEGLGEVMTINLLRDGNKDKNRFISYRLETKELTPEDLEVKSAEVEKDMEL